MRAVLDSNVVVSGVIKKEGPSGQILRLFLEDKKFTAVTSLDILAEIRGVLGRAKIRKYHAWTDEQIDVFVAFLYTQSVVTQGERIVNVATTDLDDNKLLACAQEGNADYLITGDDDLLQVGTYEGTRILPPAAFLALLKSP
jgi:putative PIN family toxin of toxin-antitoxin system